MHVEALAYTRQTLGYPRPQGLGRPAADRAGAWEGDVVVPGGRWQLGSTPADGFVFDNEKWAHAVEIAPFRIAKAAVSNAEFAAFVAEGGYRRRDALDLDQRPLALGRGGAEPRTRQPRLCLRGSVRCRRLRRGRQRVRMPADER